MKPYEIQDRRLCGAILKCAATFLVRLAALGALGLIAVRHIP